MEENLEPVKPKRVLILKAKVDGLRGAETFLKNRGWVIVSLADSKEFMAQLSQAPQPDFVILSVDHAHPQIRKLPRVIESSLNIPVIVIAENPATTLTENVHSTVVFPPISGPALERAILRIELSRRKADPAAGRLGGGMGATEDRGVQVFAGNGLSPEKSAPELRSGGRANSAMQKGPRGLSGGYRPPPAKPFNAAKIVMLEPFEGVEQRLRQSQKKYPNLGRRLEPYEKTETPRSRMIIQESLPELKTVNHTLILANGTEHALTTVASANQILMPLELNVCTRVTCFEIESDHMNGYLLLAFADDRAHDDFFAGDVKRELRTFMMANNEDISISTPVGLHLRAFPFLKWSQRGRRLYEERNS